MKRIIAVALVFILFIPNTFADEYEMYISDSFFLFLDGEWSKSIINDDNNVGTMYYNQNEYIMITEYVDESQGWSKAWASLLGKIYYEEVVELLVGDEEILSREVIEKSGRWIPIVITMMDANMVGMSFVVSDDTIMLVLYMNTGKNYLEIKSRLLEIMENASVK